MVSARSFRLALVLLMFNGILAMVALLNMYSTLAQVRLTAEIQYSSFMELYLFVAVLEFMLVVLIMPALTAGSISGEKERHTLDLMLTTKLTPAQIVAGKLMASLSTMGLMILSSFPIFAMVFVYGGVTLRDLALLLLCYAAAALFVGSGGICCSAVFSRSTMSTGFSYVTVGIFVAGTYGVNWFAGYMNQMGKNAWMVSAGADSAASASGWMLNLLLVNPTTTFLMTMLRLTGQQTAFSAAEQWIGGHGLQEFAAAWIGKSIVLQLILAAVLLRVAVWVLTPSGKKKGRNVVKQ